MDKTKHVAVIGAGICGVATALWLQRAGARVTLIDRDGPAAGTSFGNAGVLAASSCVPVTTPGLIWKAPGMLLDPMKPLFLRWSYLPKIAPFLIRYLSHSSAAKVERISKGLTTLLADSADQHMSLSAGTDAAGYVTKGDYFYGYADEAAFDADAFTWDIRRRRGFEFEPLDAQALAAFDPGFEGRFGFGVRCPDHGFISDPGAYVRALHDHFVAEGGQAVQEAVKDIRLMNGRAVAALTTKGEIAADDIVLTTGAWSGRLAKKLGAMPPLETERGYHIEFVNPSVTLRHPIMVSAGKFVATPMVGRLRCAGVVEFGGLDAPPSRAPFALLKRQAAAIFPDMDYDRVDEWMGHRPSTHDSLPVIGAAPAAPNIWFGYGHQHVGLTGGAKTGRWLAGMITGAWPNEDMAAFSPSR